MSVDFNKFNKMVNLEGLKNDMKEADENPDRNYKEVPTGEYEVNVNKMELIESKSGKPMMTIWFKIIGGEYENSMIFYNQVIEQGFQLHLAKEMLKSLKSGKEIEFEDFNQFANLILDVHEAIADTKEYALEYGEKKGYPTFEITQVFELE